MRGVFFLVVFLLMGRTACTDELYSNCINETHTNYDIAICNGDYYRRLESRFEKIWQAVLTSDIFDKPTLSYLEDEQKAWLNYKEHACSFFLGVEQDGVYEYPFGREGQLFHFPSCQASIITQRIEMLQNLLCDFTSYEDCD